VSSFWYPPEELVEKSNVKKFMEKYGFKTYKELVDKSREDIEWFWSVAEKELNVHWFRKYDKVLDLSKGVEWAQWFVGGELNVSYNALDKIVRSGKGNKLAFIWQGENGEIKKYTYSQLLDEVNKLANALKEVGVSKGDTVATYIPMLPETIITLFATLRVGAIFVPIFSGFGIDAIKTRVEGSESKVVVTADGTYRRGKIIDLKEPVDRAIEGLDSVKKVVVIKRTGKEVSWREGRDIYWDDFLSNQSTNFDPVSMESNEPALLLYTSGTTGKPKGAVISHVGALLQSSKEIYFNLDLKDEDVFMWVTDIGWMMGPWQIIGVQNLGGTHMIFEGAPDYPQPDRLWEMIETYKISILGGSATLFRLLKKYGEEWIEKHDLSSLRILGNTGEPIDPDTWKWVMEKVGGNRCPMINLSGGTEIFGCFLLPSPVVPLKPSTLWGPGLGMDIDVFNDEGKPVRGEVGYLVCKKPAPSMTRGFWKEPERYIQTYWSRWPGVWYHGDWASIDEDGYWFLHGRADDVIKIAGKRLGPAEVESIVNEHPSVYESACIGVPHEVKGEVLMCFVVLKPGHEPSEEIKKEIINKVVEKLGKPFKPEDIKFVPDLPRTRSGKIMRRLVKAIVLNAPLGDYSTLENPDSLEKIKESLESTKNR